MKVDSYVNSARTFSLIILVLGYIGWDLGTHHSKRATLLAEARELVTADWVRATYRNDRTIVATMIAAGALVEDPTTKKLVSVPDKPFVAVEAFGDVTIEMTSSRRTNRFGREEEQDAVDADPTLATLDDLDIRFDIDVTGALGRWSVDAMRMYDPDQQARLNKIADDIEVALARAPKDSLTAFERKLYNRKVSVPSIDFAAFRSEQAVWLVELVCVLALVVFRSRVHMIRLDPQAGIGAPWLVLDADTPIERAIAGLWIAGILLSSWIVTGALLFTEKDLMMALAEPPILRAVFEFLFIGTLALIGGWTSLSAVCDLLRLRAIRTACRAEAEQAVG